MKKKLPSVEIHTAYVWTCEECGIDNFEYGAIMEFDKEEEDHLVKKYGIEEWQTGEWVIAPEEVECKECGARFQTEDPRCEEEDFEEE